MSAILMEREPRRPRPTVQLAEHQWLRSGLDSKEVGLATKPEAVTEMLVTFLNDGDLDSIVGLYESGAVFADYEGVAKGTTEIRAAHQAFLNEALTLTLKESLTLEADDIALVHWSWTVARGDGSTSDGVSAEVLRRQPDGQWKFIIDNSDGAGLIGHL